MPTPQPALQQRPARQQRAARWATLCCPCTAYPGPCEMELQRPPLHISIICQFGTLVANHFTSVFVVMSTGSSTAAGSSRSAATAAAPSTKQRRQPRRPLLALPQVPHHEWCGAAGVLPMQHQRSRRTASCACQSPAGGRPGRHSAALGLSPDIMRNASIALACMLIQRRVQHFGSA